MRYRQKEETLLSQRPKNKNFYIKSMPCRRRKGNSSYTDRQAIDAFGKEACRPLIRNALREQLDRTKKAEKWVKVADVIREKMTHPTAISGAIGLQVQNRMRLAREKKELKRLLGLEYITRPHIECKRKDASEIKESVDLVEYISQYTELKPYGRNWRGLCPLHSEKSPSFYVRPDRGWHCFGCQEGGDLFTFVMKMNGCDFKEAVKKLSHD